MKKLISAFLVGLLIFSSLVCQSSGSTPYSFELDLSKANVLDSFTVRNDAGVGEVTIESDGGEYWLKLQTKTARNDLYADLTLPEPLRVKADTYYSFNVEVESNCTNFVGIFNLNKQGDYSPKTNTLGFLRARESKIHYVEPKAATLTPIASKSGSTVSYSVSVIYKGAAFNSIYIDGVKYTPTGFPTLPGELTTIGFYQVNWGTDISRFKNISIKEISPLSMISDLKKENCSVYPGELKLDFNNKLQSIGSAHFTDDKGARIEADSQINGTALSLTPKKAFVPNTKYTLSLGEVKDIFGYSFSKSDIMVNTVTKDPIYIDEDFTSSDGLLDFAVSGGGLEHENNALKLSVADSSLAKLSYVGSVPSHELSGGRYVRELCYTANSLDGKIEFFRLGDLDGEYLLEISPKQGETGLWLKGADGTDFSTKITLGERFSLAAVYDSTVGAYDIYYNQKKINENPISLSASSFKNANALWRTATEAACDSIDDIRYYKIADFSAIELTEAAVETGDIVKCYLDKMVFSFTQDITPSSISAVSLKDKNGGIVDIDVSIENSSSLVIGINERLKANTDYILDISSISGRAPLYKEGKISFKTEDSINVSLPVLGGTALGAGGSLQQGSLNASVKVNKNGYGGDTDSAALILAVYKNYKLLEIKSKSISSLTDIDTELNLSVNIGADTGDVYVKIFVVDSLSGRHPLSSVYKIE